MSASILVTGATGTIGRYLLQELQQSGASFKALVRSTEKAKALEQKGYRIAMGDLGDKESLRRAMEGVDRLFLLSDSSEQQVALQHNAIKAAQFAGVKHIVKISVLGATPNSPLQLARMHAQTEQEIIKSGIGWTFLHPHAYMQNWLAYTAEVRAKGVLYSFTSEGKYAPIDARDVAAVAAKILIEGGHIGKTYVLTGPEAISMKDVANAFELALDKDIKLITVPAASSYSAMLMAGVPDWLARDLSLQNQFYADSRGNYISKDVELLTGRKPTSVKQFAQDHVRVFQ